GVRGRHASYLATRRTDPRQIPCNKMSEETLNFFHAQGGANPASFGQCCARFILMPQPQMNECRDHSRSVQPSVPLTGLQNFVQSLLQTIGSGQTRGQDHAPEGELDVTWA